MQTFMGRYRNLMKTPKVFAVVLAVHLLAFSLLFVQQGCQTVSPEERADRTRPPSERPLDRGDYQPRAERDTPEAGQEPQRWSAPVRPDAVAPGELEPLEPTEVPEEEILAPVTDWADDWDEPVPFEEDWEVETDDARTYTVQSGDNIWNIARREGVAMNDLLAVNNLTRESIIRPGQELRIPAGGEAPRAERSEAAPVTQAEVPDGAETYTVQRGDSLSVIAQRFGTTVQDLRAANNLTGDTIRIGQELVLPETAEEEAAATSARDRPDPEAANGVRHTVVSGETPGSIANRYGISVSELMSANNIADERRMRVGQVLTIPGVEEEAEETEEPAEAPATPPQPAEDALPVTPVEQDDMIFIEDEDDDEDDVPFVPIIPDDE